MSSKRWVDGLFRERLEHRKFPLEDGEYDAMRALLEQRNAPLAAVKGGRISAWWLTALVPVAALLWWSTSESGARTNGSADTEEPTAAQVASIGSPMETESRVGTERSNTSDAMAASSVELEGTEASVGNGSSRSATSDGVPGGSPRATRHGARNDKSRSTRAANATSSVVGGGGADDGRSSIEAPIPRPLISDFSIRETIGLMGTRWSLITEPTSGVPVHRETEVTKRRSSGELHVFGAPLAVKTQGGSEVDGTMRGGSLYGLEYRVRAKYFSVATGIHYGTYAMQAGQGVADVKLNYVEVPLLAGVEIGFERFGLLVQGGMSLDFLFDSGGRYPTDDARTGVGFPDDAFNTVNYSWMLRPQAMYRLNERLSLSAGPLWKAQLGSVAQNGLLKDARASSAGISAGLTWRLDRSTF